MVKKKLLFVPGYFGSTLVDRVTKENRWVRVSDFFSNKFDLRMTETYSDLPKVHDLIDDDILYKVKLIPKILEIESYDKTLKHLKKYCEESNRELHTVTYDWRDDFYISLKKIVRKINELTQNEEKIDIVAHSNGGLLMAYYLRYGDQDFFEATENWEGTKKVEKISIVAAPLFGAFSLFKHIKDGTCVLKNKKMMSSLDYTSFCSTYFFMPHFPFHKGYNVTQSEGLTHEFNLFDINLWKENKWGPYNEAHQREIPVNDSKFELILRRAEQFQKLLNTEVVEKPNNTTVSIQVIQATGRPTYFYPTFLGVDNLKKYHYPKNDRSDGDGVVASIAAKPLPWFSLFNLNFISLKGEHLKIISDFKHQKHIHKHLSH